MSGSFKCSRLVEELKLGESPVTKRIRATLGEEDSIPCGLPLTFAHDRALTAVQLLFAWAGLRASGNIPLPDAMRFFAPVSTAPLLVVDTLKYCQAYLGKKVRQIDHDALSALDDLADQDFGLAYPPPGEATGRVVKSPILLLMKKKEREEGYPARLYITLSPVLLHGVEVEEDEPRYIRKPTDLYARIDAALGPGRGRRSPQLPRLASWIAIQRRNLIEVGSEKLALQLRSGAVADGHSQRFVKAVSCHLEVLKKAGIVRSFMAPSKATNGHWKIVRHTPAASKAPR